MTAADDLPTRADVAAAARRIAGHARVTPVLPVETPAGPVILKLETLQHTGAFKARGALATLLADPSAPGDVVAASGGNHGAAVAHAARAVGARATIFVPETATPAKIARIRDSGADLRVGGARYADAAEAAARFQAETGARDVPAFDARLTIAGQGTLAAEFEAQARAMGRPLDAMMVGVGGGGLASGCLAWLQGAATVVGAETETTASLSAALAAGRPVDAEISGLAADSLGARRIGARCFEICAPAAASGALAPCTVPDDAVREAQRWLWRELRIATEPGGAAAFAALLSGAWTPPEGATVGVVLCGANLDPADLG